jgi:hypothetical protein
VVVSRFAVLLFGASFVASVASIAACSAFTPAGGPDAPNDGGPAAEVGPESAAPPEGGPVEGGATDGTCLDLASGVPVTDNAGVVTLVNGHPELVVVGSQGAIMWFPFPFDDHLETTVTFSAKLTIQTGPPSQVWYAGLVALVAGSQAEESTAPVVGVHIDHEADLAPTFAVNAFPQGLGSPDMYLGAAGPAKSDSVTAKLKVTWTSDSSANVSATVVGSGTNDPGLAPTTTMISRRKDATNWSVRVGGYSSNSPQTTIEITRVCVETRNP